VAWRDDRIFLAQQKDYWSLWTLFMSLRSKPLEMVDEPKDCFAPDAGGSARGRPRRLGTEIKCRFAPNRLRWSMNQRIALLLMQAARRSFVYVASLQTAYGFGATRKLSGAWCNRLSARVGFAGLSHWNKMSLRSKPLEMVNEPTDCFAPDAGGALFMSLRSKPLTDLARPENYLALDATGSARESASPVWVTETKCRYAPNRLRIWRDQKIIWRLMQPAQRAWSASPVWVTETKCRFAPNRLRIWRDQKIIWRLMQPAQRAWSASPVGYWNKNVAALQTAWDGRWTKGLLCALMRGKKGRAVVTTAALLKSFYALGKAM
jgi:hypothetical protein